MAQCSSPADLSEATKTKKVAIITGITGQVTIPTSGFLVTMLLILLYTPLVIPPTTTTVEFMVSSMETLHTV